MLSPENEEKFLRESIWAITSRPVEGNAELLHHIIQRLAKSSSSSSSSSSIRESLTIDIETSYLMADVQLCGRVYAFYSCFPQHVLSRQSIEDGMKSLSMGFNDDEFNAILLTIAVHSETESQVEHCFNYILSRRPNITLDENIVAVCINSGKLRIANQIMKELKR